MIMLSPDSLLLLSLAASSVWAAETRSSESARPRGVGPEFAKFYKSGDTFSCIGNPSYQIPSSRVNDDFCDCPDGSDEPGTSACSHLSPLSPDTPADLSISPDLNLTLSLPGFYCKNKGHQPSYIPFLSVNDGVCDYDLCCDGSDEWVHVGGTKCEDKCKEIGKEWRKKDEARKKSVTTAMKKKRELLAEAARLRKEVEDRIQTLITQLEGKEILVRDLELKFEEAEKLEKLRVIRAPAGKGSKTAVLAGLAKERVEELRKSLLEVRSQRDAQKARVEELETILALMKEDYDPNFNDKAVKQAVRSWEDYAAKEKSGDWEAAQDRDLDQITLEDNESNGVNWAEWETAAAEESDVDALYSFEAYLPPSLRDWLHLKLHDLRTFLVSNGILASKDDSSTVAESKQLADARNALNAARSELTGEQNSLNDHKADLEKDYGKDGIFRALKGRCVSKDSGEYTYELCWFDRAKQKPKKGGGETNMGNFVRLDTVTVDDELPTDGKGLGSGERVALRYENGQHCWNGPNRSTLVVLACSEEDEIWKIIEEEKCVYRMEIGTPAVCEGATNGAAAKKSTSGGGAKDEL